MVTGCGIQVRRGKEGGKMGRGKGRVKVLMGSRNAGVREQRGDGRSPSAPMACTKIISR